MNNKGQVLVIFIVLLPVFLILLALVVDFGLFATEKRRIENNTLDAVEYYLENIDKEDIKDRTIELIKSNIEDAQITINEKEDYVEIIVYKDYSGMYSKLTNAKLRVTYKGFKEDKKIIKG